MLAKLLKFIIFTRFSKPLIILFTLLTAYYVLAARAGIYGSATGSISLEYLGVGFTAVVFGMSVIAGGLVTLKSDRDYLFVLPIPRWELAVGLYISQLIGYGLMILYLLGYELRSVAGSIGLSGAIIGMVALALAVTSLGPACYSLPGKVRGLVAVLLVFWAISPIFGFSYAPSAMFVTHGLDGMVAAVALGVVTTPIAFYQLTQVELGLMRTLVRGTSGEVKKQKNFIGLSPFRAVLSHNFSVLEIAGRMNVPGGGGGYRSGRVSLPKAMLVTTLAAALYAYAAYAVRPTPSSAPTDIVITVVPIYLAISSTFMSMGTLGNERLWLGFSAMDPRLYMRELVVSKALSFFALFSPFVAADAVLTTMNVPDALNSAVALGFILPTSYILTIYTSALTRPVQIREEITMPAQFSLGQMAMVLPLIISLVLIVISTALLAAALVSAVLMMGVSTYLVYSESVCERALAKLVESGFV